MSWKTEMKKHPVGHSVLAAGTCPSKSTRAQPGKNAGGAQGWAQTAPTENELCGIFCAPHAALAELIAEPPVSCGR